jgi:hypothetical protein
LQNKDHVACDIARSVLYWSLAHNCCENQNDCFILLAMQAQCAELLKWPMYLYLLTVFECLEPSPFENEGTGFLQNAVEH